MAIRKLTGALFACLLCLSTSAQAIIIPIDPGPVGSQAFIFVPFTELNGVAANGQALALEFIFTDMKHVESPASVGMAADLELTFSATIEVGDEGDINSVFLSDENGQAIAIGAPLGASAGNDERVVFIAEFGDVRSLIFHDVHFDINLPTKDATTIEEATLILVPFNENALLTVGEWSVPEPTTILLLGLGLAGLGFA